jgi:hypothetical protein
MVAQICSSVGLPVTVSLKVIIASRSVTLTTHLNDRQSAKMSRDSIYTDRCDLSIAGAIAKALLTAPNFDIEICRILTSRRQLEQLVQEIDSLHYAIDELGFNTNGCLEEFRTSTMRHSNTIMALSSWRSVCLFYSRSRS